MYAEPAVHVELVFCDVARLALDPDTPPAEALIPAHFLGRAHLAVPGDLVQLQGACGMFIVTQRVWALKAGKMTLRLMLDVLVQDQA
jgi:hypothetical protein